jgi:integrase
VRSWSARIRARTRSGPSCRPSGRRSWSPSRSLASPKAFNDEQARAVFLTLILTGVRRSELQRLRWRDVDLVESVLRVRDSKTEEGIRSIALPASLAEELWQQRRRSPYPGDDETPTSTRLAG